MGMGISPAALIGWCFPGCGMRLFPVSVPRSASYGDTLHWQEENICPFAAGMEIFGAVVNVQCSGRNPGSPTGLLLQSHLVRGGREEFGI